MLPMKQEVLELHDRTEKNTFARQMGKPDERSKSCIKASYGSE